MADALFSPLEPPLLNLISTPSSPLEYLQLAVTQRTDPETTDLRRNNSTALVLRDISLAKHGVHVLCDVSTGRLQPLIPISACNSLQTLSFLLAHVDIREA